MFDDIVFLSLSLSLIGCMTLNNSRLCLYLPEARGWAEMVEPPMRWLKHAVFSKIKMFNHFKVSFFSCYVKM